MGASRLLVALLIGGATSASACFSDPSADDVAFERLMTASAEGRCDRVFELRDDGLVAATSLRADAAEVAIGRCDYREANFMGAAERLSRPAQRMPANVYTPVAVYYQSRALQRADVWAESERTFRSLEERFSHSTYFDDALYHHGRVLLRLDLPEEARERFSTLAALHDRTSSMDAKSQYGQGRAHELAARLADEDQRYDNALSFYERVLLEHPGEAVADNALFREGKINRARDQQEQARETFERLIEDYPDSGLVEAAHYQRARSLLDAGRPLEAASAFEAFIAAYPQSVFVDNAHYRRGRALYSSASGLADAEADVRYAEADAAFGTLIDVFAGSFFERSAAYYSGRARYKLGDDAGAEERFAMVLALGPSGYDDNATYYKAMTDYHRATTHADFLVVVAELDVVLASFPESVYVDNAAYFRARAFQRAGQLAVAAAALLSFSSTYPESVYADNALYYRVVALIAIGQCQQADETAQHLGFEFPDSSYAPQAEAEVAAACAL